MIIQQIRIVVAVAICQASWFVGDHVNIVLFNIKVKILARLLMPLNVLVRFVAAHASSKSTTTTDGVCVLEWVCSFVALVCPIPKSHLAHRTATRGNDLWICCRFERAFFCFGLGVTISGSISYVSIEVVNLFAAVQRSHTSFKALDSLSLSVCVNSNKGSSENFTKAEIMYT